MTAATGTINRNMAARGAAAGSKKSQVTKQRSRAFYMVLIVGALCLTIVVMSAFAANLRRLNNELESENAYIRAEVDALEIKIGDATNISKIESIAINQYGMIHPASENCIALGGDAAAEDTNLAATIKDEAYD